MIHYILQTVVFQLLFLVVYDLFLKKETFFNWNRIYLLVTPLLSFVLPFAKIEILQKSIPEAYYIQLPAVIIGGNTSQAALDPSVAGETWAFDWAYVWYIGIAVALLFFCYKLYKIYQMRNRGKVAKVDGFTIVNLPGTNAAFTFFNQVFIGEQLSDKQKESILKHEEVHVRQKHSIDLLYFELLRILCWFNPLVYVYQNKMVSLQEFTADAHVMAQRGKKEYYQELLSQVFQTQDISFINTFFNHSLIKKRIVMLQKSKSKKIFQLKYLLLVPIVGIMLIYTACTQETNAQANTTEASFTSNSDSKILNNIAALKESIAEKGNMTPEEEKALKMLYVLTQEDGIHSKAFDDVKDELAIPFGVIERIPTYPGCEGMSNEDAKKCMAKKISEFVGANFNSSVSKEDEVSGKVRISVIFTIDINGSVDKIKARAPVPSLEKEAIRVVSMLPKMIPGEHEGVKVGVQYALPIIFEINE